MNIIQTASVADECYKAFIHENMLQLYYNKNRFCLTTLIVNFNIWIIQKVKK